VGRDFVIYALGGHRVVNELSEQCGVDLHDILKNDEQSWVLSHWDYLYGVRKKILITYTNYRGGVDALGKVTRPYPDITIELLDKAHGWVRVRARSVCSDIGYGHNKHQTKQKVKTWFHTEALPIIFEYVFL
jgi:hypothetical protein